MSSSAHSIGGPGASDDDLRAARQELSAQAEALREARRRMHEAIAERERIAAERDQTERKLNDALESAETFRTLFDKNLDAVSIVDLVTGKFIDVNPEFIQATGLSREEIVGRSSRESSRYMDGDQLERYADELRKKGEARSVEVLFKRPDGRSVPLLFSGKLVQLHGNLCCVTIARNISVLKQTERELIAAREAALAASRAKSEFLSSMSHEIRTPMNAVLGMADLLAETTLDAEQRKYLNTMINSGNALLDLINDILDLAKVESGRIELEQADFDLNELTARVCETLAIRAHAKRLELAVHIVPGVPTNLVGDPLRLRQILTNLVGNAIKFTDEGSVVVTVDCDQGEPGLFHFSVVDTGIGIAKDRLDRLFSTFTQAESSTSRKYGGTGLGLAIVKRLAELMGGKVWVESEVGKGSTFHFTARLGVQAAQPRPADSPDKTFDFKGLRALIVDDTPVNRLILREMLSAKGAEVEEVESGEQALARLARAAAVAKPYDLLVLDCRMPGMDGIEVARQIKAGRVGCRVVTLMVTSDDFSLGPAALHELGIHACLIKPIRRAELYEAIAKATAAASGSAAVPPSAPATQAQAYPRLWARSPLRILLADDSFDNRLLVQAYLKKGNHRIDTAENGEIAVSKFISGRYDLVLMDIQMPVMDGYAATRAIRKWETEHEMPRTPVIALSASTLKEDTEKSLAAGCDAHVAKPVKKTALLAAIAEVLDAVQSAPAAQPEAATVPSAAGVGFLAASIRG